MSTSNTVVQRQPRKAKPARENLPSDKFWIYGSRQWTSSEFQHKTNGRNSVVAVTPRITGTEQLYSTMGDICDILNSKVALEMGRITRVKSRHARVSSGGCKFGLTCQKGISEPGSDHGHGHTVTEYMVFHLLRLLYEHTATVVQHDSQNDYSVSDDDDATTTRTYTYYLPQYNKKVRIRAVPKANADPQRIINMLNTKWIAFIAGRDSMSRFGTTVENHQRQQKWCSGPICVNYLESKACPLKHDDDVVVLTQLLRNLVSIERVPVENTAPEEEKLDNKPA